jgi:hypothetical protein
MVSAETAVFYVIFCHPGNTKNTNFLQYSVNISEESKTQLKLNISTKHILKKGIASGKEYTA